MLKKVKIKNPGMPPDPDLCQHGMGSLLNYKWYVWIFIPVALIMELEVTHSWNFAILKQFLFVVLKRKEKTTNRKNMFQ